MWLVTVTDPRGTYGVTRWKNEAMAREYEEYIRPTLTPDQRMGVRKEGTP